MPNYFKINDQIISALSPANWSYTNGASPYLMTVLTDGLLKIDKYEKCKFEYCSEVQPSGDT